jgi:hypothetical protein
LLRTGAYVTAHVGNNTNAAQLLHSTNKIIEQAHGTNVNVNGTNANDEGGNGAEAAKSGYNTNLGKSSNETGQPATPAAPCPGESFTADTRVLLANGKAVPIAQLKPGDKVLATNTRTGKTKAEPVAAVLVHHDTDLYDLEVRVGHATAVIGTTAGHLFFDQTTHRWTRAAALRRGDRLRTPGGRLALVITGITPKVTTGYMWDLTVLGDHDFYVGVASGSLLVHNCPPGSGSGDRVPKKPTKAYGKTEVPSWVINQGETPYVGETPTQTATRIMNAQYGAGNWPKGGGKEFNQIEKWASRHFR